MEDVQKIDKKAKDLISFGAELAGSVTGGVLGFFAAGPVGAGAGAAVGPAITKVLKIAGEFAHRQLSRREKVRVGASLVFAADKVNQYLANGYTLRSDGFFDPDVTNRSPSDEILEGVMLKCKNEPEEKKCKYIAYIYANVAFNSDISVSSVNYILQVADQLTYRQLCLIALAERAKDSSLEFAWGKYLTSTHRRNHPDPAFIAEQRGLSEFIHAMGNTSEPPFLDNLGQLCYEIMSLEEIPLEDLRMVAALIKREVA